MGAAAGLPRGSSGVSVAATSMLLARRRSTVSCCRFGDQGAVTFVPRQTERRSRRGRLPEPRPRAVVWRSDGVGLGCRIAPRRAGSAMRRAAPRQNAPRSRPPAPLRQSPPRFGRRTLRSTRCHRRAREWRVGRVARYAAGNLLTLAWTLARRRAARGLPPVVGAVADDAMRMHQRCCSIRAAVCATHFSSCRTAAFS